ncbi:MAG: CBS domain-containing protein [Chitinophagaceae bacterium]|nr:MAG: CBS domain-containing protein [Chitinophagaceae bacterium]
MERVSDLLIRKYPQFNTASNTCLISDALYQMCCENVDYLIVMEDNKFKGIITEHDIVSRILFEDRPLNKIEVNEFVNTSVPVTTPEASLQSCMQMVERFNVKHIAVFDHFDFKGVISSHDLMQEALHSPQRFFVEEQEPRKGYPWNY